MSGVESEVAYIGLGSNLGDRLANLRGAVELLTDQPGVALDRAHDVASLFETSPVGGPGGQAAHFNSAVRVRTKLGPHELLRALLDVEERLGRKRGERWGARVIDLDLLMYGDQVIDDPELTIPHLRLQERRFVLEPLREIAAAVIHPALGRTIDELAAEAEASHPEDLVVWIADAAWAKGD